MDDQEDEEPNDALAEQTVLVINIVSACVACTNPVEPLWENDSDTCSHLPEGGKGSIEDPEDDLEENLAPSQDDLVQEHLKEEADDGEADVGDEGAVAEGSGIFILLRIVVIVIEASLLSILHSTLSELVELAYLTLHHLIREHKEVHNEGGKD